MTLRGMAMQKDMIIARVEDIPCSSNYNRAVPMTGE